jgi:hypothetical protein
MVAIFKKDPASARRRASLVIPKETLDTWSDEKVSLFEALCGYFLLTGKEAPQEYIDQFKEMETCLDGFIHREGGR